MSEIPILFTPENAQKCHDGTKTQTRRIIKPQPWAVIPPKKGDPPWAYEFKFYDGSTEYGDPFAMKCPYGAVGDRLWVREAWAIGVSTGNSWRSNDDRLISIGEPLRYLRRYKAAGTFGFYGKWRPSIHMPKWACRTWLEITEVRVQRLQEISRQDAKEEGFWPSDGNGLESFGGRSYGNANEAYRACWESINGAGSWDANPWVWAITFKKVTS